MGSAGRRLPVAPVVLSWLAVSLVAFSSHAAELRGRLTSNFYSFEESGTSHLRPYLSLQSTVTAWRGAQSEGLTFHTNLRWRSDLSHKLADDPQTFVYDAYFQLAGVPKSAGFYFGRQYVYSGVGGALIDGLRARYLYGGRIEISVFGGSQVSRLTPEKVRSVSDYGYFGGRFAFSADPSLRLGLNWMLSRSGGEAAYHRGGLDVDKSLGRGRLYARTIFDLINLRPDDILGRVSYRPGRWYLAVEFQRRLPSAPHNTLFSLIDFSERREVRFDVQREVWRKVAVVTQAQVTFLGDDRTWHTSIGVRTAAFHLAYLHLDGDRGKRSGLQGYVSQRYRERWEVYASADASTYKVQPEQPDSNEAYSAQIGLRWRGRGLTAGLEGQYLQNAFQTEDYRLLLRLTKDFSLGSARGR